MLKPPFVSKDIAEIKPTSVSRLNISKRKTTSESKGLGYDDNIPSHTRTIIKKKKCLSVCLSVCLYLYVEKNGAADMDNRGCKM